MSNDTEKRFQMAAILAESLYDRGPRVPDWPEDERDLYREISVYSFTHANEMVEMLRFSKAAQALIDAGYGGSREQ